MSSSAKRALTILAAVGDSSRPMGVTEIARAIRVAPGTAFRGLDALQHANLLARHPSTPRYVPGPMALGLRQSLLSLFPLREICLPYLRQLASASGETTSLHVRVGWYAARIAAAPGTAEVTSSASLGSIRLLSADFAGRAILAHLDRKEIARHLAWAGAHGFERPAKLERDLALIRARFFAESAAGEGGLAFPIRKPDQAFASVAIEYSDSAGTPSKTAPHEEWREIARAIEAVVRASPALACQPFEHIDPDEIMLPS